MSPSPACESLIVSTLDKLLFTDFLKCACDGDYSCLVLAGTPTDDEITAAWVSIVTQYQELTGTGKNEAYIELSAKISRLNCKILCVSELVKATTTGDADGFIAELKEWGYGYGYTAETLSNDLERVIASLGNDKTKLAIAIREYKDTHEKEQGDDKKATKLNYMQSLFAIEQHTKMEYDLTKFTAYKFAVLCRELQEYNRIIQSKYKGYGTK